MSWLRRRRQQRHTSRSTLWYGDPAMAGEWLVAVGEIADVTAYKRLSFDFLDLRPGQHILDLGCGRGDDARAMAARVGPGGMVTAVDADATMIVAALASHTREVGAAPVGYVIARGEALPFADGTFDAVRIDRVLQHIEEPVRVLSEVYRVLRPGGRVLLVEPDWKTIAIHPGSAAGGDDDSTIAAILAWHVAHTVHPIAGRQLRALLTDAAFADVLVRPLALTSTSFAVADLGLELSAGARKLTAESNPPITHEAVQDWIAAAEAATTTGHFFACLCLFFALGFRPSMPPNMPMSSQSD